MSNQEEARKVKKGDWLFSCGIKPRQFSHFHNGNPDSFETTEGSCHSVKNCSLGLMSDAYAHWFNENKVWELYKEEKGLEVYESEVKKLCGRHDVKFEGI